MAVRRSTSVLLLLLSFFCGAVASASTSSSSPSPSPSPSPSAAADRTLFALLHFKASIDPTGVRLSSWNTSHFCHWPGIKCDDSSQHVKALVLSSIGLDGSLSSSLGQMQSLQTLDLSLNHLFGALPSSLGQLNSLLFLDLSQNHLSGALPSSLGQMASLQVLDFSGNNLSHALPSSLGQMKSLRYLYLSHNQLSGPLPTSLSFLHNLDYFDVSFNQLQGAIPNIPFYSRFSPDSFRGNPSLCDPFVITNLCDYHATGTGHEKGTGQPHAKRNIIIVVVCVVAPVSLLASFWAWWFCFNRKDPASDFVVPHYKAWTINEMKVATNSFDTTNVIGSGVASTCYLGVVKSSDGMRLVALKMLVVDDNAGEARKSFVNEFKTLCNVRHRNLVKLLGYCVEGGEVALVMEYMEKGDLDRLLHDGTNKLSWEERVNVALDIAEGLVYLHHEYGQPIIHCDVKPKNILLSSDMVAKISDFGIAKLLDVKERGDMSVSKFRGTFGYIAPEYGMGFKISTKVDVYSYGMLLLELVTGVRPTSTILQKEAMSLRTWVDTLLASGQIREALRDHDLATWHEAKELLRLGVHCTNDAAKKRPTMYMVRDFILELKKQRLEGCHPLFHETNVA